MNRKSALLKILLSVVVIAAGCWFLIPHAKDLFIPERVVDGGGRGLLVISTQGGGRDIDLHVRQQYSEDGSVAVVFYLTSEGISYGEGGNAQRVDFKIDYLGKDSTKFSCGKVANVATIRFNDLSAGPKRAIEVDSSGGRASATNYGNALPQNDMSRELNGSTLREYPGTLWPLDPDSDRRDRQEDNNGNVFAEKCTLGADSTWRLSGGRKSSNAETKTLLPFQVNWTSIGANTDFQKSFTSRIVIDRQSGIALSASYPEPRVTDDQWLYEQAVNWTARRGDEGNIGYTDQPTYIFQDRNVSEKKSLLTLWSGVLLGIIATLLISVASLVIDIFTD